MSLTDSISQAIATMEGFFTPGTIAQRNNNPGNLRTWGSAPIVDGYAQFSTPEEGWAALNRQVDLNVGRGLTLQEFFAGKPGVYGGYSPGADKNDPAGYAVYVASRIGLDPTIPLNSIPGETLGPNAESGFLDSSVLGEIDWTPILVIGGLLLVGWLVTKR